MSHKITEGEKRQSRNVNQPKFEEACDMDEVPLISMDGYATNHEDTVARMEKALRSLEEARQQIILCEWQ